MALIGEELLEINGGGEAVPPIEIASFENLFPDSSEMEAVVVMAAGKRKKRRGQTVDERCGDGGGRERGYFAGVGCRRDPLEVLGLDVMVKILSYLDARSVALSLLVSRGWHGVASSDRLWSHLNCGRWGRVDFNRLVISSSESNRTAGCKELWIGKAHIPQRSIVPGLSKLATYSRAMLDGKRVRIRREDLCDHVWEFHFTKGAPEYWRNLDPYWKGTGPPMRRYFHPDGSQSADPDDMVWGGHECCYTVVTSILHDGNIREHYVRINRWPRLCVSRRNDWGWEMSNFLYAYSSIPDAYKEGGTGPLLGPI